MTRTRYTDNLGKFQSFINTAEDRLNVRININELLPYAFFCLDTTYTMDPQSISTFQGLKKLGYYELENGTMVALSDFTTAALKLQVHIRQKILEDMFVMINFHLLYTEIVYG